MRELLLARVRPLAEQLAVAVTEMLLARVELLVDQASEAFDVALSAIAGELESDVREVRPSVRVVAVPEPAVLAKQGSTSTRPTRPSAALAGKRRQTCRTCGAIGFNSKTCGISHNLSTSPVKGAGAGVAARAPVRATTPATSSSRTPPPTRADRFAAIEAAAARRAPHTAGRMDAGIRPTRGARRAFSTDLAEEDGALEPRLPEPTFSIDIEPKGFQ